MGRKTYYNKDWESLSYREEKYVDQFGFWLSASKKDVHSAHCVHVILTLAIWGRVRYSVMLRERIIVQRCLQVILLPYILNQNHLHLGNLHQAKLHLQPSPYRIMNSINKTLFLSQVASSHYRHTCFNQMSVKLKSYGSWIWCNITTLRSCSGLSNLFSRMFNDIAIAKPFKLGST